MHLLLHYLLVDPKRIFEVFVFFQERREIEHHLRRRYLELLHPGQIITPTMGKRHPTIETPHIPQRKRRHNRVAEKRVTGKIYDHKEIIMA